MAYDLARSRQLLGYGAGEPKQSPRDETMRGAWFLIGQVGFLTPIAKQCLCVNQMAASLTPCGPGRSPLSSGAGLTATRNLSACDTIIGCSTAPEPSPSGVSSRSPPNPDLKMGPWSHRPRPPSQLDGGYLCSYAIELMQSSLVHPFGLVVEKLRQGRTSPNGGQCGLQDGVAMIASGCPPGPFGWDRLTDLGSAHGSKV